MWFCSASCAPQQFRLHASEEVVAEVLSHVICRQGPAPNIMKVKVLKERKIADRTLLHLHGNDRSCRKADTLPCPCAQNNHGRRWERMRNAAHPRPKESALFSMFVAQQGGRQLALPTAALRTISDRCGCETSAWGQPVRYQGDWYPGGKAFACRRRPYRAVSHRS